MPLEALLGSRRCFGGELNAAEQRFDTGVNSGVFRDLIGHDEVLLGIFPLVRVRSVWRMIQH